MTQTHLFTPERERDESGTVEFGIIKDGVEEGLGGSDQRSVVDETATAHTGAHEDVHTRSPDLQSLWDNFQKTEG